MTKSQKTPHGKRVSDAEMQARMAFIENLMADGEERAEIVARARLEFPPLCPRTVDDYCARVRERWARESAAERPTERAATVKRLRRKCNDLWKKGACGHAIQLERLLVDIVGLRAPEPLEMTTVEGTRIDWRDLVAVASTEELEIVDRITHAADEHRKARGGTAELSDFPVDEDVAVDPLSPQPEVPAVAPAAVAETTPAVEAPQAAPAVPATPRAAGRRGSRRRSTATAGTPAVEAPQEAVTAADPPPDPPAPWYETEVPLGLQVDPLRDRTSTGRTLPVFYPKGRFTGHGR